MDAQIAAAGAGWRAGSAAERLSSGCPDAGNCKTVAV
jgi:hypothetical protein